MLSAGARSGQHCQLFQLVVRGMLWEGVEKIARGLYSNSYIEFTRDIILGCIIHILLSSRNQESHFPLIHVFLFQHGVRKIKMH